jgi:hypothetical protein
MAGIYFAQGCSFTWKGVRLSNVRTFEFTGGEGDVYEVSNVASVVTGTGAQSRVVKTYDTLSIEPTVLRLTCYGPPLTDGTLATASGTVGKLAFSIPGNGSMWSYTVDATLSDWTWSCQGVAQPQEGSVSFKFGGW